VFARAIFSDEICQEEYVVWLCRGFDVPRDDRLMPLRSPVIDPRPIRNSDGMWTLDGPGTLLVEADEHSVTYQAPSSRPNPAYWTITFTHRNGLSSHGLIRFIGNEFNVKFVFYGNNQTIGYYLEGTVQDEFRLSVEAHADGSMTVLSGPYNEPCATANTYAIDPAIAASTISPFEFFTAGSGATLDSSNGNFTGIFPGTTLEAGTSVTFPGPSTMTFPAGPAADIALTFFVNGIDFAAITTERSFPLTGTDWTMIVSPAVGPM
jgi:hypothetical protein